MESLLLETEATGQQRSGAAAPEIDTWARHGIWGRGSQQHKTDVGKLKFNFAHIRAATVKLKSAQSSTRSIVVGLSVCLSIGRSVGCKTLLKKLYLLEYKSHL